MTGEDTTLAMSDMNDMGAVSDIREGGARAGSDSFTNRLLTYDQRWAGLKEKEELARAGFRYTGVGDKVECEQCGLKLLNWTSTDNPLHEHATRRPLCPFINSRYRQLGQTKPPKHPQYQQLQDRLDSFVSWPGRYVPKTPEELAAAGFFYIGSADRVTCFQCGITLRDWEEEHDPVVEHQRYSENCQFINKTDVNDLGVATRTINNNDTNQSGSEQTQEEVEAAGACGGETTAVSGHTFEKSNMVTCQTSEDEALPSVSSSIVSTSSTGTDTGLHVTTSASSTPCSQPCPEPETEIKNVSAITTTSAATVSSTTSCSTSHVNNHPISVVSKDLVEENRRLKERRTCRVCQKETVSILFLPCGHLVTCSSCAPKVSDCVVCGKTILGTVRTYFT